MSNPHTNEYECVCVCVCECESVRVCEWVWLNVCECVYVSVWVTVCVLDSHDRCRYSLSDWLSARASSSPLVELLFLLRESLLLSAAGILNVFPTKQYDWSNNKDTATKPQTKTAYYHYIRCQKVISVHYSYTHNYRIINLFQVLTFLNGFNPFVWPIQHTPWIAWLGNCHSGLTSCLICPSSDSREEKDTALVPPVTEMRSA